MASTAVPSLRPGRNGVRWSKALIASVSLLENEDFADLTD